MTQGTLAYNLLQRKCNFGKLRFLLEKSVPGSAICTLPTRKTLYTTVSTKHMLNALCSCWDAWWKQWCRSVADWLNHHNTSPYYFLFQASYMTRVTRKQTLRSLSLSYQKKAAPILLLVWHRLFRIWLCCHHRLYSREVGVIPKEGWARPRAPILLLVWQRQRP